MKVSSPAASAPSRTRMTEALGRAGTSADTLAPGKEGLLEVRHADHTAVQRQLTELVQDGRRWRIHRRPNHGEVQQRHGARVVGGVQLSQRHAVGGGDFVGIGSQLVTVPRPDHERRDQVARAAEEIVKSTQDRVAAYVDAYLLVDLAQRRLVGFFVGLQATTWQGPLAAVAS